MSDISITFAVVIARGNREVARLVPVNPGGERELGFAAFGVPATFFDDLPEDERAGWEGGS